MRLDIFLYEKGYFESREKAKAAIMAGQVLINGDKALKPGQPALEDSVIKIQEKLPYVSRGGLKLEKALKYFLLDLTDLVVMDVGASTGGFTDCALQNGAKRVVAVDVGYGQLAWKLRCDSRVKVLERTNIRYLTTDILQEEISFFTVDVSFISLTKVLPVIQKLTLENARGIALIKPQFEAGKENIGKKGVVKDPKVHEMVLNKIGKFIYSSGWDLKGLTHSPIKGPEGNIEYLAYLDFAPFALEDRFYDYKQKVEEAFRDEFKQGK